MPFCRAFFFFISHFSAGKRFGKIYLSDNKNLWVRTGQAWEFSIPDHYSSIQKVFFKTFLYKGNRNTGNRERMSYTF